MKKKLLTLLLAAAVFILCAPAVTNHNGAVQASADPLNYNPDEIIFRPWDRADDAYSRNYEYVLHVGSTTTLDEILDALHIPMSKVTDGKVKSSDSTYFTVEKISGTWYVTANAGFAIEQSLTLNNNDSLRVFTRVSTSYSRTTFRNGNEEFNLDVGSSTTLADLLSSLGISGTIEGTPLSSVASVTIVDNGTGWTVTSNGEFSSSGYLAVTVDGVERDIDMYTTVGGTWRNFDQVVMHWSMTLNNGTLSIGGNGKVNTDTTNHTDLRGDEWNPSVPTNNKDNGREGFTIRGSKGITYTPWRLYNTYIRTVIFEPGVTTIGCRIFQNKRDGNPATVLNIERVIFNNKDSLVSISAGAFWDCKELIEVDLSGCYNLVEIKGRAGDNTVVGAFQGCNNLVQVDFNGCTGLQTIGQNTFNGCSKLTVINLSDCINLRAIENNAFNGASMMDIDLSGCINLTTIGTKAFYGNTATTHLDMSNLTKLTTVGESSFENSSIVTADFSGCTNLTSLGKYTFKVNSTSNARLISVDLTGCNKLTWIQQEAYKNQAKLQSITIPEGIIGLGENTFQNCSSLTILTWNAKDLTQTASVEGYFPNVNHVVIGASVQKLPGTFFEAFTSDVVASFTPRTTNQTIWMRLPWDDEGSQGYRQYRIDERGHVYRYPEGLHVYPDLSSYIEQAPSAKSLRYTGVAQELVNPGSTPADCTIEYRLGTTGTWTTSVPTAINAGSYQVYYRAYNNDDITLFYYSPSPIQVTINKAKNAAVVDTSAISVVVGDVVDIYDKISNIPEETTNISFSVSRAAIGSITNAGIFTAGSTSGSASIRITMAASTNYQETKYDIPVHNGSSLTVTFMDGETFLSTQTVIYGNAFTAPDNPVKEGFAFSGWDYNGEPFDFGTPILHDITLTARWKTGIDPVATITGWTYGDSANAPSVTSGNPGAGTVTYLYKLQGAPDDDYSRIVPSNAGTYTLKAIIDETEDYAGASTTTDFVIEQKEVTLTWSNTSMQYSSTPRVPTVTVKANGKTVSGVVATVEGAQINVGNYTATAVSLNNPNYKLPAANTRSFTITPKQIYVTNLTALDKVYDGTTDVVLDFNSVIVQGLIGSEHVDVTATGSFRTSDADTDKIVDISNIAISGSQSGNYTLVAASNQKTATATILVRTATITAINQTVAQHGSIDTSLSMAFTEGLVDGHSLTAITLSVQNTNNDGPISISGATIQDSGSTNVTSNYDITYVSGELHVTTKTIPTVTAPTTQTLIYNGNAQSLVGAGSTDGGTLEYSLESGSGYSTSIPTATNAGSYRVYYRVVGDSTYADVAPQFIEVAISPKTIGINWTNTSLIYDRSVQTPTANATGLIGSDTCEITVEGNGRDVGSYTATATAVSNANYELPVSVTTTYTITPKAITVSGISALDKVYDHELDADFDYNNAVLTGRNPADLVTVAATGTFAQYTVGTNIEVTISAIEIGGLKGSNYTIVFADSQHTSAASITQRPVSVEWGETNLTYNGTSQAPSVNVIGFISGDTGSVVITGQQKNAGGPYTATASSITNPNYMPTDESVTTFTISKAPIVISGIAANDKEYDQTTDVTFDLESVVYGGIFAGDSLDITVTGAFTDIDAAIDKTVTIDNITLGGTDIANYYLADSGNQSSTTATITPKTVTLIWASTNTLIYNGEAIGPTLTIGGVIGLETCDPLYVGTNTNAGTYVATATGLSNHNYQLPTASTTTYIISPREIVVSGIMAHEKEYDRSTGTELNYANMVLTGRVGEDDVTAVASATYADWLPGLGKIATLTDLTLIGTDSNNYVLAALGQQETAIGNISRKVLALEWSNLSFTYDGETHKPTVVGTNVLEGDTCTIDVSGEETNYGTYTAIATALSNGACYVLPAANSAQFTIGKRTATVVWDETTSFVYNGTNQAPTIATITNIAKSSDIHDWTVSGGITNVGTSTAIAEVMENDNYIIIKTPLDFEVTPRPVVISWSNTDLTYNGASQQPTATITNVIGSDSFALTIDGAQTNAGDYMATVTALGNANYTLDGATNIDTDFTISKRAIHVDAINQEVELNHSINTGVEYVTVATLINGHSLTDISLVDSGTDHVTTVGTITPGTATIMDGSENVTANYAITYYPGNLTVTKVHPEYSSPTSLDLTYNGATQTLIVAGTSTDGTTMKYSLDEFGTFSTELPYGLNAGSYTVFFMVDGGLDYENVATQSIIVEIKPRVATIAWSDTTFTYDKTNKLPTATITNLVAGDSSTMTVIGSAVNAGTHTATLTAIGNTNYTLSNATTQTFTINKKEVAVSGITAQNKAQDGNTTAVLVTNNAQFSGLIEGDSLTVSAIGNFVDANVGDNKTVNITGLTLGGPSVNNYKLATTGNQTTTTASIIGGGTATTITISFNANGGSGSMTPVSFIAGAQYILPDCLFTAPDGKEFLKWDLGYAGTSVTLSTNTVLTAVWKNKPVQNWSITLTDGDSITMVVTIAKGERYILPENPFPVPSGKVFDKWTRGNPGTEIEVNSNITITALWKDAPATCTVTLSDGSDNTQTIIVNKGERFTLPECTFTAPDGKVFDTWSLGAVGSSVEITGDTTITAIWKDRETKIWTVTLSDGKGNEQVYQINDGDLFTLPACPFDAPEGKQFSTWSMGAPGNTIVISSNITITAIWEDAPIATWTVRLSDGHGNNVIYNVEDNSTFILPACPFDTPEGMSFVRWNIGEPGTRIVITSNVIITAVWEIIPSATWTVVLDSGTGLSQSFIVENGDIFTLPECPFISPMEKVFDRWSVGIVGAQITITSDMTITALWKESPEEKYYPVEGEDQSFVIGSDTELTFSIKRADHDELTFDLFIGIEVDHILVSPENYEAKPGSVIVTLNKKYLDSLKSGYHVMTVNFIDGSREIHFHVDRNNEGHFKIILITGIILLVVDGFATTVYVIRRRKNHNDWEE